MFRFGLLLTVLVLTGPTAFAQYWDQCSSHFIRQSDNLAEGPYSKAFRASMKVTKTLMERTQDLVQKWPNNVKIVNNVTFEFNSSLASGRRTKKMLAVSLKGLDSDQETALLKDYIDHLSLNSVSFPLNERAGHLHTRFGSMDLDAYGSLSQSPYRFPSSKRLESVVALSDVEFSNLRQYMQNIDDDYSRVLGSTNYGGVKSELPGASLNSNGTGHNCTSWITLAPIGADGSSLRQLVGGGYLEIHTNPGWWTTFVQMRSDTRRVPYTVYITRDQSMGEIVDAAEGKVLQWDYDLH